MLVGGEFLALEASVLGARAVDRERARRSKCGLERGLGSRAPGKICGEAPSSARAGPCVGANLDRREEDEEPIAPLVGGELLALAARVLGARAVGP